MIGGAFAVVAAVSAAAEEGRSKSSRADLRQGDAKDEVLFENRLPCAMYLLDGLCAATEQTEWVESDRQFIRDLIARLSSRTRTDAIRKAAVAAGYRTFVKFRRGFEINARGYQPRKKAMAWVLQPSKSIGFIGVNQRFIDVALGVDPISGFDVKEQRLLHELFHVIDRQRHYSEQAEFRRAYDEAQNGIDPIRCQKIRDQYLAQLERGDDSNAWIAMRNGMIAMRNEMQARRNTRSDPNRFPPTAIACMMTNDRFEEAFAEFASFWYLDPKAKDTFPTPIAAWLAKTLP